MKRQSNKSINRRIKFTFTIIIIIMSFTFFYSNIMKGSIVNDYKQFMRINIKLSDLSVEFNNSWIYFDSYMKERDVEYYKKFKEANEKVESIMDSVRPYVIKDKDSGIYFMNLIHMFDWYKEHTNSVIYMGRHDSEIYEQMINIRTMNRYISQHSRSLISAYLQYTNFGYLDTLDKYKLLDTNLYLLLIITILLNVSLIKIVTEDIIRTINNLSLSVKQLSNANWDIPDIEGDSYKELDNLIYTFNHMKNSIKSYIEKLNEKSEIEINYQNEKIKNIEKDKIIRETQLKAFQMQINPHFLFNNLNTISRMAMFEGADKTVELVDTVSKILRYNLLNKENLVKVREEIENVKAYILMQKIKYEDRISFDFEIEEDLNYIYIPPMIVQLLVENAISHGFLGPKRRGRILIKGSKKGEYGLITIKDNGNGIPQEDLAKLRKGEQVHRKGVKSTGLGIKNISKRLELYFGRDDLLSIESKEGVGTKVSFLIPIEESESIAKSFNSGGRRL